MNAWFSGTFRARRRCRQAPPLGPPQRPAGFDFDALAKEVAAGVSRREALRRLGAGLGGAALAALGLGALPAHAGGNSYCAHFCTSIYPPGAARDACINAASLGQGVCWGCGPAAPAGHPDLCGVYGGPRFCCTPALPDCCGGSTCVNKKNDLSNCGACGNVCPQRPNASRACYQGVCGYVCSAGYADCNASAADGCETNLLTDVGHCGACDNPCPVRANATTTCTAGVCGFTCNSGFADCNGNATDGCEINLLNDPSHCGACNHTCASGEICVNGKCTCGNLGGDCPGGKTCCNGMCEDLSSDLNNCGACSHICPSPTHGQSVCQNGQCGFACQLPYANCSGNPADGCGINLSNDPSNCRTCGFACAPGQQCVGGNCITPGSSSIQSGDNPDTCPEGPTNLQTDNFNCGTCGKVCPASTHCDKGQCVCNDSSGGLPKQYCNGACIDVSRDTQNCGGCGVACTGNVPCCGGQCTDTGTDNNNCGSCGIICQSPATCVALACECPFGQTVCGTGNTKFCCAADRQCCYGICCLPGEGCDPFTNRCECPVGKEVCGSACIDILTDPGHCGGCTNVCSGLKTCIAGKCVCPIQAPTDCGGTCVATISDNNNCGGCGHVCTGGHTCVLGVCDCPVGRVECFGTCCAEGQVCDFLITQACK